MMSDSSSCWAERSEASPHVCTISMDPTCEQDRALVNNLRMMESRDAPGSSAASFASVAANSTVAQASQNVSAVRGSFRPRRPEYLTRFERNHFHVHNVTPERPCSAFFNIQDPAIRTREIFDALLREGIPANGVRCVQRSPNGGVDITFQTIAYRDKFVGLAAFNIGQRQHVTHPSRNRTTFVTVYDAPCEMLDSAIHYRLSKYGTIYYQRRGKLHDFPGVLNGLRHLRMEIHTPIPSFLRFGKFLLRVQYDGQPKTCRRCNSQDHISRECNNIVCFNCEGTGHESKECPEKVRCCICRKEDHMAIDCSYSWSKRPASHREAEREALGDPGPVPAPAPSAASFASESVERDEPEIMDDPGSESESGQSEDSQALSTEVDGDDDMDSTEQDVMKRSAEGEVSEEDDFRSTTSESQDPDLEAPRKRSRVSPELFSAEQDDRDSGTMDIVSNAPT